LPDTSNNYLKDLKEQKIKITELKQKLSQLSITKQTTISVKLAQLANDIQAKKMSHAQFNTHLSFLQKKKEELQELKAGIASANVKLELKVQLGTTLEMVDEHIESYTQKMEQFKKTSQSEKYKRKSQSKPRQSQA
jgi:hypothetical protein